VLAERLLAPLREAKVDTLLLGCTHYPFLARTIGDIMGRDVVLVSSADETAFEVRELLLDGGGARIVGPAHTAPAWHRWLSSGDVEWFDELGRRLLGPELAQAEPVAWDDA
jgi:glutamate racemase